MDAKTIETILTDEIASMGPGEQLPTERDLIQRFDTTRSTVRRALDSLESRFLIRRVLGSGTFTADRVELLVSNQKAPSLHASVKAAGHTARTQLVSSEEAPLPERPARMLGVEPGTPTLTLVRAGTFDDIPATYAREWLLPSRTRDLYAALGIIESVYEALQAFGFHPERGRSVASVEDLPSEIRTALGLRTPALGWRMLTTNVDAATQEPLMVSDTWLRMDLVRLAFDFS